jgi:hypothetical protein
MKTTALTSGALAAGSTTLLSTGKGTVNSIQLTADGTNAATVTIYDEVTATGKVVAVLQIPATGVYNAVVFVNALRCDIGLTVVVAGTGAVAYVGYGA